MRMPEVLNENRAQVDEFSVVQANFCPACFSEGTQSSCSMSFVDQEERTAESHP